MRLRVAVLQSAPRLGCIADNASRAEELCAALRPGDVHILCLPELALTGYNFPNAASIAPHLAPATSGPTHALCAHLARQTAAHVVAGFPELPPVDAAPLTPPLIGYNSAFLLGPDARLLHTYRKTNLFQTDFSWAASGTGFRTITLPPPLRVVSVAICMDLNPARSVGWTLRDGPFELAHHAVTSNTDLLILSNAWLETENDDGAPLTGEYHGNGDGEDDPPNYETLNYWAQRLRPLWANDLPENIPVPPAGKLTTVIVCNRTGVENGVTYAGSSAIFRMYALSGRHGLHDMLGRRQETLRVWDVAVHD